LKIRMYPLSYQVEVCEVSRLHQQILCTLPDLYHELDEGLLPIWGAIPNQKLSAVGDRDFQLCLSSTIQSSTRCPLSKIPGYYVGWQITVRYPATGEYDIRDIIFYDGKTEVASKDYRIVLKDALRIKPECDDQYGCPSYTLSGKIGNTPSNVYSNPAHAFPGFCGLHQVRVRVDGQESKPRTESRENVNKQSVIYLDDKPHVLESQMSPDGMRVLVTFDVQTTHARPYRGRPGLRSDVFKVCILLLI
jgi:hypothetical protein